MKQQIMHNVCSLIFATLICAIAVKTTIGQNVPPPPAQRHDRFGVYHWAPDYSGFSGTNDQKFAAMNNKIAELKTRTIRITLGSTHLPVLPGRVATQSSTAFGDT